MATSFSDRPEEATTHTSIKIHFEGDMAHMAFAQACTALEKALMGQMAMMEQRFQQMEMLMAAKEQQLLQQMKALEAPLALTAQQKSFEQVMNGRKTHAG